ncbi:MAG: hypothetical protein JZU65_23010 [Chlorobium sp.]|nr:hypothetical protein [Chlorobium sp.]
MSKSTNSIKKLEAAEDLSPATLAEIAEIRASEAEGRINKEMAERHIRVITGFATGKGVNVSMKTDLTQMMIAHNGISRIGALLSIISENISHKTLDPENGCPLECATIDSDDAYNIVNLLEIANTALDEICAALTVLCAE